MRVKVSVFTVPIGSGYVYAATNGGLGLTAVPIGEPDPYFPIARDAEQSVYSGDVNVIGDGQVQLPDGRKAHFA